MKKGNDVPQTAQTAVKDLLFREMQEAGWFADYIQQPHLDLQDSGLFATIVRLAVDKHGVDVDELADKFGVARTTISRWKRGANAPQLYVRPIIVKWIETKIRDLIKASRAEMAAA